MDLEGGGNLGRICSQIQAFLCQRAASKRETLESLHVHEVQSTKEADEMDQPGDGYQDLLALFRFLTLDVLCQGLQDHAAAAAFLESSAAAVLLEVSADEQALKLLAT